MSTEARPRRRWLQFSLRSLLVLTLVVASFCAGVTYQREVRQRLRAELEQAKSETENANRRATLERLNGELARIEAEQAQLKFRIVQIEIERTALEGDLKTIKTRGKATRDDFDAIINALRLRIEAALSPSAPFKPPGSLFAPRLIPTSARLKMEAVLKPSAPFKPPGGLFAPRLVHASAPSDLRNPSKNFQFRGGEGKPSLPDDDFPIPKPKPRSSFDFDQPLLDRTIG
jgi:hypothetical protein